MLCQMCLQAEATIHVGDPTAGDPPAQVGYCQTCYYAKYVNPLARPPDFPRPSFTIKRLMIIVGVFVILNAAVALIMRSSLVIGTPMQRRDWTLQAFLLANITSGLMAAYFPSIGWLQKAEWHKRTGGLVPAAQPKALAPREWFKLISVLLILSVPFAAWAIAVCLFLKWLTPLLWPGQRPHILLISAVIGAPLLVWVLWLIKSDCDRHLVESIRAQWRGASRCERLFRILVLLWPFIFAVSVSNSRWAAWFSTSWITSCALVALMVGVPITLMAGLVVSTRRR